MPINRPSWHRMTPKNSIPSLPCPACTTGKLKLVEDGLTVLEPKYSSEWRDKHFHEWAVDHNTERWTATLQCDELPCGEIVNMIGDVEVVEAEAELPNGEITWSLEDVLRIQAVYPAPPLIRISGNVPRKVIDQLMLAFRMYWTDTSACVARLRTAVEALLDHQKVPKERLLTTGKNAGKMYRMNLAERINGFADGAVHKDQLQGLRNIGNLGTHGTEDVTTEDLFDAIDVLEFVLTGIYDTKTINAKAKKLEDKKASN